MYVSFNEYLTNERITLVEMDKSYIPVKGDIIEFNKKKYTVMGRRYTVRSQSDYGICVLLREKTAGSQLL